jgi:hypothetical protein
MPVVDCYTDGGLAGRNPSAIGGSWAYALVSDNTVHMQCYGFVTPGEMDVPAVTNNLVELLAAVAALEALPLGWEGKLYTDSLCTQQRLITNRPELAGVPDVLESRLWDVRRKYGLIPVVLLDGHPTRKQLLTGFGKRGNPVSPWNKHVDRLCTLAVQAHLQNV